MEFSKHCKQTIKFIKSKQLLSALIAVSVLVLLLLAFPFRFLVVPAIVNGQPVFSWTYLAKLHQTAGSQVINQLISEKLVEQEIKKQGVQVTQGEINAQIKDIESQFGTQSGGLDTILSLQGLTRDEFIKQLRLNLSLEKLVKGNIEVTDEEVDAEIANNPGNYQGLSEIDAATTAAETIRATRLQSEFQNWFQTLRSQAKISNFLQPKLPQTPANPIP